MILLVIPGIVKDVYCKPVNDGSGRLVDGCNPPESIDEIESVRLSYLISSKRRLGYVYEQKKYARFWLKC